jgi:hypothetical protein
MFVPPPVRVGPIVLIVALAIMVLTLVYAAVNRAYQVSPNIPPNHAAAPH